MTSPPRPRRTESSHRRWVPRSPFRAVVVLLAAAGTLVAITAMIGGSRSDQPAAPVTAAGPPSPSPTTPVPAWTPPPDEPVPASAVVAATEWVNAFLVRPGQTRAQWLDRLVASTTPEFLGVLDTEADDTAAPTAIVGPATAVGGAAGSAEVDVPTDQGAVRVLLVAESGRWLVGDAWRVR